MADRILMVYSGYKGGEKTFVSQLLKYIKEEFFLCFPVQYVSQYNDRFPFETYNIKSLQSYFKIKIFIEKNNIQLIHCNGFRAMTFIRVLKMFWLECPPVLASVHGFHYARYKNKLKKYIMLNVERILCKYQSLTIAPSKSDYDQLLELNCAKPDRIKIISYGIPLSPKRVKQSKVQIEEELKSLSIDPVNDILIYSVGALEWVKGHEVIVKTAEILAKLNNKIKFLFFFRDDELLSFLSGLVRELKIESNVFFMKNKGNLDDWFNYASIYVAASRYEGLPYTILEAMNNGIPVIASNVVGCRDLITDKKNGLLFERDNHQKLATRILELISDQGKQTDFIDNNYKLLQDNYDERLMCSRYQQIYTELIV